MESLKKCSIIDCHENFANFLAMTERQNAMTQSKPLRHCEALAEAIHNLAYINLTTASLRTK
ncbi:hypothetical protein [Helicobacter rodentium]|uniref:hypothetical protein n=1 Tax=Helicobacter rodentium TaxID=59617 RepID=UPI002355B162|nr:hypothetical protein [Helicobacter rodentium]